MDNDEMRKSVISRFQPGAKKPEDTTENEVVVKKTRTKSNTPANGSSLDLLQKVVEKSTKKFKPKNRNVGKFVTDKAKNIMRNLLK